MAIKNVCCVASERQRNVPNHRTASVDRKNPLTTTNICRRPLRVSFQRSFGTSKWNCCINRLSLPPHCMKLCWIVVFELLNDVPVVQRHLLRPGDQLFILHTLDLETMKRFFDLQTTSQAQCGNTALKTIRADVYHQWPQLNVLMYHRWYTSALMG